MHYAYCYTAILDTLSSRAVTTEHAHTRVQASATLITRLHNNKDSLHYTLFFLHLLITHTFKRLLTIWDCVRDLELLSDTGLFSLLGEDECFLSFLSDFLSLSLSSFTFFDDDDDDEVDLFLEELVGVDNSLKRNPLLSELDLVDDDDDDFEDECFLSEEDWRFSDELLCLSLEEDRW